MSKEMDAKEKAVLRERILDAIRNNNNFKGKKQQCVIDEYRMWKLEPGTPTPESLHAQLTDVYELWLELPGSDEEDPVSLSGVIYKTLQHMSEHASLREAATMLWTLATFDMTDDNDDDDDDGGDAPPLFPFPNFRTYMKAVVELYHSSRHAADKQPSTAPADAHAGPSIDRRRHN